MKTTPTKKHQLILERRIIKSRLILGGKKYLKGCG
jgi:hypothetical protein